ncbi:hypothetical protein PBAL39_03155 [Pedobacter sp. BAL39]|uniref:hypothetical protein n=1 Tax=Pedobacter sp. BAL39 TaxID=391596 RepID=UPI000155A8F8|nr:hypothetical protein [Pedobacter sp. BAL39]EDM34861.1 hypothetical protein PBAL39_03155 [Pedobacter sp. BAL39]
MIATDNPEKPGKLMKRKKIPATITRENKNKKPFKKDSILKAATTANSKNVKASTCRNMVDLRLFKVKLVLTNNNTIFFKLKVPCP